jgi:F0F1-type ATP synthase membrane subunit a
MKTLSTVVIVHLIVSFVHGAAHSGAQVALGPAGTMFVYVVILAGPLVGLVVAWRSPHTGAAIVALAMAGSLVFGLVNHFIIPGTDHVAHVAPEWRTMFASTAALLVLLEAAGTAIGVRCATRVRRTS